MKTDNYLTLCLEQASKSSLRYRHGCIVVRGGKVIGQGYNDYRSGFNGGALKTGRLASGAADGAAIAELKRKQKQKQKQKPKSESESRDIQDTKPFTPFEGMGGGSHANTPLSMHSEMMAIHSALSSSSTMASSALSSQKPCFKLSGDSKRKARLRKDGLKAYVERVCLNALNQSATELRRGEAQAKTDKAGSDNVKERDVALSNKKSAEKHRLKNLKNGQQGNQYQYDRSGQQKQLRQQSLHKLESSSLTSDVTGSGSVSPDISTTFDTSIPIKNAPDKNPATTQTSLLPKGRTGQISRSVTDRMKHPRLNGADIYVARLGWKADRRAPESTMSPVLPPNSEIMAECSDCSSDDSLTDGRNTHSSQPRTGSLHEELVDPHRPPNDIIETQKGEKFDRRTVLTSRPCYRCICYMDSVGIKRVYWTNEGGQWEGAKVRDLVDALEGSSSDSGGVSGGPTGNGVFVTKHEVLMLRRLMGNKS
ncbi:uncharacterized protein BDZ99DRAFT_567877 [Mytilinidion resinicola]|uniref:CMP/dCMP-type deaminase domain-containing protein n=1 Tax=Mytilinidion resinicola TaxID=574789 RepID=A0A6A6YZF3_9PEZI|nr:uncharacterized protein BDZ99DRAFT_567877 [Mytilinidion resinicola]KAF2814211.1 hypothetical protein BDZ99DRAFT_567877 [Mytilinidion resinicola]